MNSVQKLLLIIVSIYVQNGFCLKVSIYYETLCMDTKRFIIEQLSPSYAELKNFIDLEFIPYGKATHEKVNNGKWKFLCQHNEMECKGNKYHSCALALIPDQENQFNFVNCSMHQRNSAIYDSNEYCAKMYVPQPAEWKVCASSTKGDDLLAVNGDKTYSLEPSISFVPTIVFNDIYDNYEQNLALYNFKNTVLRKIAQE